MYDTPYRVSKSVTYPLSVLFEVLEDDCVVDPLELAKLRLADLPGDSVTYFGHGSTCSGA